MKKSFILILTVFSVLLIAGCSKDEEVKSDVDIAAIQQSSFQGIIEEIPAEVSGVNATHLINDGGENIYLRSVLFDLNKFEGSELRVSGSLSKEEVSGVEVSVLSVESRDLISLNEQVEDTEFLEFADKGFSIELENGLYEINEKNDSVKFESESMDIEIKPIAKGLELELSLFIDDEYGDEQIPQSVLNSNGDRFSKITLGSDNLVYLRDTTNVIYEISFRSYLSSQAESAQIIDNILESIDFDPLSLDLENDIELNPEVEPEEDKADKDDASGDIGQQASVSEPVNLESLSETSSSRVNKFISNKNSLIGADSKIMSYGFTEDNYVYVVYKDASDDELRSLYKIDGDAFELIAEFEEGIETDWELKSGENLAFNKALTMVFVEENGYREVFLSEGYRYFESRPLSFGLHYPKNWYYAREGDAYLFSDKPIGEADTLVEVEITDESFGSVNGSKVSENIVKLNSGGKVNYFVKKENEKVLKLIGGSDVAEELEVMAKTVLEVK